MSTVTPIRADLAPETAVPASPDLSEAMLLTIRTGGPEREEGRISESHQMVLAMYLPDMVDELLALRAMHGGHFSLRLGDAGIAARLLEARAVIDSDKPATAREIGQACGTLIAWSRDPEERAAARAVLAQINGRAKA